MTSRGPGGRVPNQGRGPQAKGVGRNSKRHDLERPTTPGQTPGSDLQQGDVQALEDGQRIAPVQQQADAIPAPAQQGAAQGKRTDRANVDLNDPMQVIQGAVGNTASATPSAPSGPPDQGKLTRARAWINFHSQLAQHPSSSPLYRAQVQNQLRSTISAQAYAPDTGGALFMRDVDDVIEGLTDGNRPGI